MANCLMLCRLSVSTCFDPCHTCIVSVLSILSMVQTVFFVGKHLVQKPHPISAVAFGGRNCGRATPGQQKNCTLVGERCPTIRNLCWQSCRFPNMFDPSPWIPHVFLPCWSATPRQPWKASGTYTFCCRKQKKCCPKLQRAASHLSA